MARKNSSISTSSETLVVAENSGPAPIGILAPTDTLYPSNKLIITVTGLPNDGTVLRPDGITPVSLGATLTVAQLTGLMFKPTAGAFGQSSTFSYKVSDPAGLSANGTATVAIGPDTIPPTTTDPTLTVAPNSGVTPIGIPAPTDPNFIASQLNVTVTELPSDGTVLLSDGVTAVTAGETLSVAQLTALMFQPAVGLSGQSSSFTYTVANPAGLTASGTEVLAIAAASTSSSGISPDGSGLVAGTGGTLDTSAGLWSFGTVTGYSGYEILLNGQSASGGYATSLEVLNQGQLYAYNSLGSWYEWNGANWTGVSNPFTQPVVATPTPISAPVATPTPPSLPVSNTPLSNSSPLGFSLQNTQSTTLAPHEVIFGEVFSPGQISAGSQLIASINGISYSVQLDVKTSYADGSVEFGILTFDAPAIPANSTLDAVLSAATAPAAPAVDISKLPGNGYNLLVNLTLQNGDGTQTSYQLNAGSLLSQALAARTATYWLQGTQATEVRFDVPVAGSFHVTFDVTSFADGSSKTDVQFNNDAAMQASGGTVTYSETITQNGATVSQQNNITQYQYQDWDQQVWSNGAPQVNVVHNVAALEMTGAIPAYDLSWALSNNVDLDLYSEAAQMAASSWGTITDGALPVNGVTQFMPMTGGRPDIGPATQATALWLITQNQTAALYALGQADAAGSVPWNFFDPTTGNQVSVAQYPDLWVDPRGGIYNTALTQQISSTTGWSPDPAHQPDLSYEAYLLTGNRVFLDHLNAQANFSVVIDWPGTRDQGTYTDIVANGQDQVRQQAWSLREIDEAAYANPDGSPEKAYFTQIVNDNWTRLVNQLPTWTAQEGQAYGYIPGTYGYPGTMAPWQQDYFASSVIQAAEMGNQDAVKVLQWESNFLVGRFLNSANGFSPTDGFDNLIVSNGTTVNQTWAQIETATQAAGGATGSTAYAELALQSLAGIITVDSLYPTQTSLASLTSAMQAYGWVLSCGSPYLRSDAQFQIAPRLPDGNFLYQSNIQIDTTSNNLTLTTTPGADSLLHAGGGSDTLVGGAGATDLLYGGTGNDVFQAGTGNPYMFGGSATNTFIAGTGNDYMQGAGTANTYVFNQNNTGQDIIGNFNTATDTLNIAANLNGNGITTTTQLLASATVNNGNTVFHLSPNDDIALLGFSTPANLTHSILVS